MADQETRLWTATCFLAFVMIVSLSSGFNLDPRFSVIKTRPNDTYFGYSVTQHQIVNENGDQILENLLLVGAPKEKVQLGNKISGGAIYKCNALSTREDDCQRLTKSPFDLPPRDRENAEDQWLGVVLQSSGKGQNIVTCAHRLIDANAAVGTCYTLTQDLETYYPWNPCGGKPHINYLEDFGLCQAGMSAKIGAEESLLMGAPGSVYWRGVIFHTSIDPLNMALTNSPSPMDPNEEGAATAQLPPTDKYSYLGYSVEMGKFDGSGTMYYVSGAPRSHDKGEVVFFVKKSGNPVLHYEPQQKLIGERDFSAFGSSLLVVDLNNDKFDDLIVSAPYYYEKGIGGAIYIYYGSQKMIDNTSPYTVIYSRKMEDSECEILGCIHARFGMSLAKLGDVNNDGYQDFAVGAPYEGNGTVYIYHGSKNGVSGLYAQRITASDMPNSGTLKSFGYSLSGGLDLDANGYPDLLVGSYESGTVSLLRSRAIIRLEAEVQVRPNMTDLSESPFCDLDGTKRRCVELEMCLKFTAEPAESFTSRPIIMYRVEAERTRSFGRLELENSTDPSKKFVEGSMTLYEQSLQRPHCEYQKAYLKESFTDKLNPMELTVKFFQEEQTYTRPNPGDPLKDINLYPILSTEGVAAGSEANTISVFVDFLKECGPDNKCFSNLQFEVKMKLTKDSNGIYIFRDAELSETELEFTVTNLGEAAYLTRVFIQKPPRLDYQSVSGEGQEVNVKCMPVEDDDTLIVCDDIGNPLKQDVSVTFTLKLNSRIELTDQLLNITTWVNTSSTEQTPQNDNIVLPFRVIKEADLELSVNVRPDDQILCSGDPHGASDMKKESDIGTAVNHTFIVTNKGPSSVPRSTLIIEWPHEVESEGPQGKFLLYLMQEPIIEKGTATCTVEKDTVNPLGIAAVEPEVVALLDDEVQPSYSNGGRRKRETLNEGRVKRSQGGLVVLGCKQKTARCRKIRCELGLLQSGIEYVTITLQARLWESTLLQDYRKSRDVQISSYGYLEIDPALKIQQETSNDNAEAVTYAVPDFKDLGSEAVEWWWIFLAVLGGIILLVLIIFCLYKIGFFKRKRPEDMQMYRVEKKQQKMLDEEIDEEP